MSAPEQSGAGAANRVSGEDMPRWVTVIFVALGTLLAITAAWLALTEQPTPSPPMASETRSRTPTLPLTPLAAAPAPSPIASPLAPPEAAPVTAPASLPAPEAPPAAPLSIGGDPLAAPPVAVPAGPAVTPAAASSNSSSDNVSDGSSDEPGQTRAQAAPSPNQPVVARATCPPPIRIPFELESVQPVTKGVPMDLNQLRTYLHEHPQTRLSVEGHADATGAENYNLLLSYRRAKAVVALLARAGLPEQRMLVRAAGSRANIAGLPGE
ncbi:MAG: OmpA family protein, partial [Propionivibrio sp.]